MKTAIVTGGSSGIGKSTCEHLNKEGYKVYDFSRHGKNTDTLTHIDCDVTDREACAEAVKHVYDIEKKIDLLVSNAGMGISGPIEFTAEDDLQLQMDVNFMGSVNISQAVLPYMREAGQGKIIFVSSLAACVSIPFQAFYSASKAAVSSYALALLNEVRPFNIKIAVVLPGDIKTGFTAARKKTMAGAEIYTKLNRSVEQMEHDEINGMSPDRIADRICRLAASNNPRPLNTVGLLAKTERFLMRLLPTRAVEYILYRMY